MERVHEEADLTSLQILDFSASLLVSRDSLKPNIVFHGTRAWTTGRFQGEFLAQFHAQFHAQFQPGTSKTHMASVASASGSNPLLRNIKPP